MFIFGLWVIFLFISYLYNNAKKCLCQHFFCIIFYIFFVSFPPVFVNKKVDKEDRSFWFFENVKSKYFWKEKANIILAFFEKSNSIFAVFVTLCNVTAKSFLKKDRKKPGLAWLKGVNYSIVDFIVLDGYLVAIVVQVIRTMDSDRCWVYFITTRFCKKWWTNNNC